MKPIIRNITKPTEPKEGDPKTLPGDVEELVVPEEAEVILDELDD